MGWSLSVVNAFKLSNPGAAKRRLTATSTCPFSSRKGSISSRKSTRAGNRESTERSGSEFSNAV